MRRQKGQIRSNFDNKIIAISKYQVIDSIRPAERKEAVLSGQLIREDTNKLAA